MNCNRPRGAGSDQHLKHRAGAPQLAGGKSMGNVTKMTERKIFPWTHQQLDKGNCIDMSFNIHLKYFSSTQYRGWAPELPPAVSK